MTDSSLTPQQKRAWSIFWWLILLLGASSVVYGYAHISMQNQRQQLNSIVDKNIEVTQDEIATAKQLLEGEPSIDKLKEQLKKIEPSVNQIISQAETITDATEKEKLTQASKDIRDLTQTINNLSSLNPEQVRNYAIQFLTLAEKELQTIHENEKDTSFFWKNLPLLWAEIAFWSWIGTILYLLSEIYTYYQANSEQQKFIEMTPWYFITLLRGTFIVFMILLGATTINIGFGQAVNFSDAPATLYVFLAGVLGYFNRMAKEQLIIIVQAVFPEAWKRANPEEITAALASASASLKITPEITEISYGQEQTFKIESGQSVNWSANLGSFNLAKTGQGGETVYKAPTEEEAKDGTGNPVTQVIITATSVDDSSQTTGTKVSLKNDPPSLKITPEITEINYGQEKNFKIESGQFVNWSANLGSFNLAQTEQGGETVYKAPTEEEAKDSAGNPVTQITITATSVDDSSQTAEMTVSLKTALS